MSAEEYFRTKLIFQLNEILISRWESFAYRSGLSGPEIAVCKSDPGYAASSWLTRMFNKAGNAGLAKVLATLQASQETRAVEMINDSPARSLFVDPAPSVSSLFSSNPLLKEELAKSLAAHGSTRHLGTVLATQFPRYITTTDVELWANANDIVDGARTVLTMYQQLNASVQQLRSAFDSCSRFDLRDKLSAPPDISGAYKTAAQPAPTSVMSWPPTTAIAALSDDVPDDEPPQFLLVRGTPGDNDWRSVGHTNKEKTATKNRDQQARKDKNGKFVIYVRWSEAGQPDSAIAIKTHKLPDSDDECKKTTKRN